jgi:hypothetical protein
MASMSPCLKYYFLEPIVSLIRWMVSFVSVRSQPKASMRTKLPNGDLAR